MSHQLHQDETGRYHCATCGWSWHCYPAGTFRGIPLGACPGVRRYRYEDQPEHLLSKTELHKQGLRLASGQEPAGCRWSARGEWVWLYDTGKAVPRPQATAAQLAALEKARTAWLLYRTCARCGYIVSHRLDGRPCAACQDNDRREYDRAEAAHWAQQLLASPGGWLLLDTETTGLDGWAEVIQIGILAPDGTVLLDALLRPTQPIPPETTQIHGISNEMVADAPPLPDIYAQLCTLLQGKIIVTYNAAFDERLLAQSCARYALAEPPVARWLCAMEQFSVFCGDWSHYWEDYRWQRLPGGDHTAIGDCRATLRVLQEMAAEASQFVETV